MTVTQYGGEQPAPESSNGPPPVPPPPDDAPPEAWEAHWYHHVYQGDRMPQLTLRAVITGGIIGMFVSVANLYTTLKLGWAFGVAITACVISYVVWNVIRGLSFGSFREMTILENNCMQSTASAAGYSTGSTIATAFGALLLMQVGDSKTIETWTVQNVWVVASFTFVTACLGVFLAVPLKRQMINVERLPFPSGIAAAATLRSLYSKGREAAHKAYSLIAALFFGGLVGFFRIPHEMFKWLDDHMPFRIPELLPADGFQKINGKKLVMFGFEPSVLLIAAGMIVGLRVSLSMLLGAALLYCVVGPLLVEMDTANAGVTDYKISIPVVGGGTIYHFPRWALWGGTSVMVFASLAALAVQWRTVLRSFGFGRKKVEFATTTEAENSLEARIAEVEVPRRWLVIGLIPISIALIIVNWLAFSMNPFLGLIAVAMSFVLSMVACRATGETDTTPIGAMGKVMQFLFAVLPGAKGDSTINLMSAATAANSSSSAADLLTDLKSGYILGANPRKQFIAQFCGVFFGTLAIVPAWYLLVPNKERLESFNPPATNMWKAVADVLAGKDGISALPASAIYAILIGALVGTMLPIIDKLSPPGARKWIPSAMGLGLAWVVPFANAFSFAIGAVLAWVWSVGWKRAAEMFTVPIASGLVAGESLVSAFSAMTKTVIDLSNRGGPEAGGH